MKIGRDTAHTLALAGLMLALGLGLAGLIVGAFGWLRADIAATNERLAAVEAGLARTTERLARLEGAVGAALGRPFADPPDPDAEPDATK